MIQDFPLTGIGLNTFPIIADKLYPMVINGPDARIPHAHDIFLQTAVDLGVPGLIAFVVLLTVAVATVALARRSTKVWQSGLVAGLGAGLLAHFIFGLTDAVTLGAKPGVLLWIVLGTAIGLGRLERPEASADQANTFLTAFIFSRSSGVGWLQAAQCLLFVAACASGALIR
jgi:putative inorganic carbon (HCO3(-)) transporter